MHRAGESSGNHRPENKQVSRRSHAVEELMELKAHIEQGRYAEALALIGEMEEMSREDKAHKMGSFIEILLIHLIKRRAEGRSTRSWDVSIKNALESIEDVNTRRKSGGRYLTDRELKELIDRRYRRALRRASLEAFEGSLDEDRLASKLDEAAVKHEALQLIMGAERR
jgi:hypothetical protein